MQQIQVQPAPLEMLKAILAPAQWDQLVSTAAHARSLLAGRVVWNVNATAHGGGVAEMLQGLLAYARGAGVDARWLVLDGDAEFFAITKRLHNALHGSSSGGHDLGASDHLCYERVLRKNLVDLKGLVQPGDIVVLHDPQTAGLVEGVHQAGAHVIWRSHIGRDDATADTDSGWEFLRGYLTKVDAFVFSRQGYVPDWVAPDRVRVIAPSIDPFSTKNCDLNEEQVGEVLRRVGLIAGPADPEGVEFTRRDGTVGRGAAPSHPAVGFGATAGGCAAGGPGQPMGPAQRHGWCPDGLRRPCGAGTSAGASDVGGTRCFRSKR